MLRCVCGGCALLRVLCIVQATTAWTARRARRCWTQPCGSERTLSGGACRDLLEMMLRAGSRMLFSTKRRPAVVLAECCSAAQASSNWLIGSCSVHPVEQQPIAAIATCHFSHCRRLSYYRFADCGPLFGAPRGYDRVRQTVIGKPDFE